MSKTQYKMKRVIIGALLAWCLCGCTGLSEKPEQLAHQQQADRPIPTLEYIEVLTGDARAEDELPMVAIVHGLGDRPESFIPFLDTLKEKVRVILPRGPTPWRDGFAWFDRSQKGNWDQLSPAIARSAKQLALLLARLARRKPTRGRPILTGFSQGGMLSYAVATAYPETIGLAVPISGLLPIPLRPAAKQERAVYPRIRALHGRADGIVPIAHARDTVAHLKEIGLDATLEEYSLVAHTMNHAMRKQVLELVRQELKK